MKNLVWRFMQDEEGATAVEYGVLVALIIAACIVAIQGIGGKVSGAFTAVDTAITPVAN